MPGFDILGSRFDGGQAGGGAGFDVLGAAPGSGLFAGLGSYQGAPQPQGAPVSGLLAGALGLPTYGGAMPGASYLTPPNAGQPASPQLQQLLQMGGLSIGSPAGAAQPRGDIGSAVGSGLHSLFDGVVGSGR